MTLGTEMKREYLPIALFLVLVTVVLYLFYRIMVPFFAPVCWAAIFAIVFYPFYERLLRKIKRPGLSSGIVCFLVIILIIGPLAYLFVALVDQAAGAVAKVNEMYQSGELSRTLSIDVPWLASLKARLAPYYDLSKIDLDQVVRDALNKVSGVVFDQTTGIIANGARTVLSFLLMIFTMYYFFKDGDRVVGQIKRVLPLEPEQVETTFRQLRDIIYATMYGGIVVAMIQGFLGAVLFVSVGIPSAIFWGAVMAFLGILPIIGAFLVYVPAGLILFVGGSPVKGILVIVIGSLVISQVDNVIRPYLVSGRTSMHPLLLFFAMLGGVYLFGLLGVVLGPMIAALVVTLIRSLERSLNSRGAASPQGE
jgi:predicted PurR-regulated permease PerM